MKPALPYWCCPMITQVYGVGQDDQVKPRGSGYDTGGSRIGDQFRLDAANVYYYYPSRLLRETRTMLRGRIVGTILMRIVRGKRLRGTVVRGTILRRIVKKKYDTDEEAWNGDAESRVPHTVAEGISASKGAIQSTRKGFLVITGERG
jgi:hypothetical protein